MSGQLAEPTLLSALEAAVREGRDGWPEAQAKHAFESGPRLKQVMLAELDEFRTQLVGPSLSSRGGPQST